MRIPASIVLVGPLVCGMFPCASSAFDQVAVQLDPGAGPGGHMVADCVLDAFDTCSGWIWTFGDESGAVWGTIFDPSGCEGGCLNGGSLSEVALYTRCAGPIGEIGGVGVARVDAAGCRTALLWNTGPITVTHCISGDRWTYVSTPLVSLLGNPFAITVEWTGSPGTPTYVQFAGDNGIANLFCSMGHLGGFPGCAGSTSSCGGWTLPPQRSVIYVTDINGDGTLDDLCALYGTPLPLAFPYLEPYGYLPNNLMIAVGLDCSSPEAVGPTSWGRVKALFD